MLRETASRLGGTFLAHDGTMKGLLERLLLEDPAHAQLDSSPVKNQAAEQQNSGLHLFNQQI